MRATHVNVWTSWKFLHTTLLTLWAAMICINYWSHRDELELETGLSAGASWLEVAGMTGLCAAAVMIVCIAYGVGWDSARWCTINELKPVTARVLMHISSEIVTVCIIAVASVYLYVHQEAVVTSVTGSSWVVVLGAIAFGSILVDRIMFSPCLLYIEILSSPCLARFSQNTRLSFGNEIRTPSAYSLYLNRLFPLLPKNHMLYSSEACCEGIPLVDLYNAPDPPEEYEAAARTLIIKLQKKYDLSV